MASKVSIDYEPTSLAARQKLPADVYHAIFSLSTEPIAVIGADGFYLEQNAAHIQLLGYEDQELIGQTPALHIGQEALEDVLRALTEHGEYRGEVFSKTKSGETKQIELSAFTMRDEAGEPVCFVAIKRDITERKRTEEESHELIKRERAARAEAEKANRLKDEFLATLSHELRTPLNAVIGWSRMLNSGRLDREDAQHALEVIERNAWAQKQIIEDILDVSRVITGKLQLNLGPVDLVAIVDAALDAVRPAMEAKDIKIETVIDSSLKMISGDADRLQQVVWNVLSNAAKFTPAGGQVQIHVNQTATHVQIRVSDSGPGIAPEFLPHVFERFRQADGSTTRTHGGLGLGLAIVRHLVELHGGAIGAENRTSDSGAIFTVKLPLPSTALNLESMPSATPVEENVSEVDLQDVRIVIVDDELDALDLLTIDLIAHGAHVRGATSAIEA